MNSDNSVKKIDYLVKFLNVSEDAIEFGDVTDASIKLTHNFLDSIENSENEKTLLDVLKQENIKIDWIACKKIYPKQESIFDYISDCFDIILNKQMQFV